MSDSDTLIALRLALLVILFLFILLTAATMRGALQVPRARVAAAGRPAALARLVVIAPAASGLRPGDTFSVAGEMTIGRDSNNGIVIADSSVSSSHARIGAGNRGWRVTDLGSTNGTFINSSPVDGRWSAIRPGDTVEVGSVVLRFEA